MNEPTASRRSERRRVIVRLQRPWVSLVLLALLVFNYMTLTPGSDAIGPGSRAANALAWLKGPRKPPGTERAECLIVFDIEESVFVAVDASTTLRAHRRLDPYCFVVRRRSGFWALTHEERSCEWIHGSPQGSTTLQQRVEQLKEELPALLGGGGAAKWSQLVALASQSGSAAVTHRLWTGDLRN